jgi:hypothetical protein
LSNKRSYCFTISLEKMDGCEGAIGHALLDVAVSRSLFVGEVRPRSPIPLGTMSWEVNLKFLSRNSQFKFRFPFFCSVPGGRGSPTKKEAFSPKSRLINQSADRTCKQQVRSADQNLLNNKGKANMTITRAIRDGVEFLQLTHHRTGCRKTLFSVGFRSKLSIKCSEFGYNLRRAK